MTTRTKTAKQKTTKRKAPRKRPAQAPRRGKSSAKASPNGNGHRANGNGHRANGNGKPTSRNGKGHRANGNGNGHRANGNGNGNGNGAARIDRKVIAQAKVQLNGNGTSNGNGALAADEARRVAAELGNALLVATSIETARHSDDVELITGALCDKLEIGGHERDDVLAAARLHDIGKASIPRAILDKPGPLEPDEWELMRQHTVIGEQILASVDELKQIALMVRHSHERWDGLGYPDGLAGEEIPLGSRIIFCADAFHAMRCDRAYRVGRTAEAALTELRSCAGTQFDPRVVRSLDQVVRDLRIVRPRGKTPRSSRLTALLLVLAVGGGGSALARTNLTEQAQAAPGTGSGGAPGAALSCDSPECASIFGATLLDQMRQLGLATPERLGVPGVLGVTPPGLGRAPGVANAGGTNSQHKDASRPGSGSTGGESDRGPESSGGGEQGSSGSSPGKPAPGNSGNAPGNSGNAPGNSGKAPGNSGNAPGNSGNAPGNSGNAPGHNKP